MKVLGLVIEAYGKYVKVKTKDGEMIIKTERRAPKEGTHIELKDSGYGDFSAKVLAKSDPELAELPSLRTLEIAEKILKNVKQPFVAENERDIQVRIALLLDEVSKRVPITGELVSRLAEYLSGTEDPEFEAYVNLLSGKYGLVARHGLFVFLFRSLSKFELFSKGLKVKGTVSDRSVTLNFSRIPENVEELEKQLRKHFEFVSFKLEGMEGGFYV